MVLGIIFLFFKGITNAILALTGFKKAGKNNKQSNQPNNSSNTSVDEGVIYEKGETKVFKGMAGTKTNKENKDKI